MKKSNFVALVLSVLGVLFLGLGMSMCLKTDWDLFQQGIVVGCIGFVVLLVMIIIYRRMEHKTPLNITPKALLTTLLAIVGTLGFGFGMCLTMVFGKMVLGIVVGIIGIILLLCLIPMCKGLK